jgi:MFS family permease
VIIGLKVIQGILYNVPAPDSYLVLAIIGSILMVAEMVCFSFCREEDGPAAKTQTTWGQSLRRGWGWLRNNRDYRMYFWQRISFRINYLSLALFIPYGRTQLKNVCSIADVAILGGVLVATLKASRVVGALVWGRLADWRGYRPCFVASGVFFIVAPALALLAPRLPVCFSVSVPLLTAPLNLPLGVYLVALVAIGLGSQAQMIAGNHFRITTAPPRRRVSYAGFLNTITSPLTLLPLAGAYLAEAAGPAVLFGLLVASGGFALIVALRMTPGRASPEPTRQLRTAERL